MSLTVRHSGPPAPRLAWTAEHMRAFALAVRAHLVSRTFDRGIGESGREHRHYSRTPIKLYRRSQTGRRLSPKGGVSFAWVRGPRQPGGGYDASRIGDEAGKFYAGGYEAFKAQSRKGLVNAGGRSGVLVDLTLSGQLSRGLRVVRTSRLSATIGMTGESRAYGVHVDAARPFMGLSAADGAELSRVLGDIAEAARR